MKFISAKIKPLTNEDLEIVFENEKMSYSHPWTKAILKDCLYSKYECFGLSVDQYLIGHSFMTVKVGEAHLLNLTIHPAYQGQGYGKFFLLFLIDTAQRLDADIIFLEVRKSNKIARKLYLSVNFNEIGIRRNYYPCENNHREDAVIFAKTLISTPFKN